jgi:F-type H+-transporting ATPase subunit delta
MQSSSVTSAIVAPYAQALMSLAQSQDLVDRFGEDVRGLLATLVDSPDLKAFLANPLMPLDGKKAALNQIVGDQLHPYLKNFLMLLVDRRRIGFLDSICQEFQSLLRALKQAVLAEVTSAVALNDGQKAAVCDRVKTMTGAQSVELDTQIDLDLLGGVIIKVGSQVVDASLRSQLRRISIRLAA